MSEKLNNNAEELDEPKDNAAEPVEPLELVEDKAPDAEAVEEMEKPETDDSELDEGDEVVQESVSPLVPDETVFADKADDDVVDADTIDAAGGDGEEAASCGGDDMPEKTPVPPPAPFVPASGNAPRHAAPMQAPPAASVCTPIAESPATPDVGAAGAAVGGNATELPKKSGIGKKVAIALVAVLCVLGLAGAGVAYAIDQDNKKNIEYFSEHFFDNTVVAGVDVSRMDAQEASDAVQASLDEISVSVEDGGKVDTIDGPGLAIKIKDADAIAKLIEDQDEEAWKTENETDHSYDSAYVYDPALLDKFVTGLACVSGEDRTDPVDAVLAVEGAQVVIKPGVDGNRVAAEALTKGIDEAIARGGGEVKTSEFFVKPRWTGEEPEFKNAKALADKWTSARIDYTIDMIEHAAIVDADDIVKFITIDNENISVALDEEKVKEWFGENTRSFDTVGTERQYTTPSGDVISLSGGHYGWMTDEAAELPLLMASIENGEKVSRDFSYEQTALGPKGGAEWGNTYIDIDISQQIVRYIQNGEVVLTADTVTGNEDASHETQRGFYSVLWKDSPHVMVGDIVPSTGQPEYRTPCQYFILFNYNGSACHDADHIRSNWGKSAHYYDGSHGCANMHYSDVANLWDLCSSNDPVIVHD